MKSKLAYFLILNLLYAIPLPGLPLKKTITPPIISNSLASNDTSVVIVTHEPQRIAVDFRDEFSIKSVFQKIYPLDSIVGLTSETEADIYITEWEFLYDGKSFTPSGDCKEYKIMQTQKNNLHEGRTYREWFVILEGEPIENPLVVETTESQGQLTVEFLFNEDLADGCTVVSLKEAYSGGDLDLNQYDYLTFYAISENGFNEIITIISENKIIRYYFVEGATPEVDTYTREDFTILSTSNKGLHDLDITTNTLNEADEVTNIDRQICKWNGIRYECLPAED